MFESTFFHYGLSLTWRREDTLQWDGKGGRVGGVMTHLSPHFPSLPLFLPPLTSVKSHAFSDSWIKNRGELSSQDAEGKFSADKCSQHPRTSEETEPGAWLHCEGTEDEKRARERERACLTLPVEFFSGSSASPLVRQARLYAYFYAAKN